MSHRIQDIVCDCMTIPVWNRVAVIVTVVSGQSLICFSRPAKKVIFNVNAVSGAECFRIQVVFETLKLLKETIPSSKVHVSEDPYRDLEAYFGFLGPACATRKIDNYRKAV